MKQLVSKNTFLASSSGVPVATDVITTDNDVFVNPKADNITYKDKGNGAMGNEKTVVNDDFVKAEFTVDALAKPTGTAGTAPSVAELFKICGLKETVVAGTSVAYTPDSISVIGKATAYLDGYKRDITGMVGSFTFNATVGATAKFSFSLKGFTTFEEAEEPNPAVVLDTAKPYIVNTIAAVTLGGATVNLESADFDYGAAIESSSGTEENEYYISDFKPTVKVKAIKVKGNSSHWTQLKTTEIKELIITLGTAAGSKLTFKASYCAPSDTNESDSGGKVVYERTWACQNSAGNDNFEIKYH